MARFDSWRRLGARITGNRLLTPEEVKKYDVSPPPVWGQPVVDLKGIPPGSGIAYLFSPYVTWYAKMFGVIPIADITKYRLIFRSMPDVMGRINKRVILTTGKKFTIRCEDERGQEAAEWLMKWAKDNKLQEIFQMIDTDTEVYGNGYVELVWDKMLTTQVELNPDAPQETEAVIKAPLRAWVEEDGICPKCNEHTLMGVRYLDEYQGSHYGDFTKFVAYRCTNLNCNDGKGFFKPQTAEELTRILAMPAVNVKRDTYTGEETKEPFKTELTSVDSDNAKSIVNMKVLDPIYMRVRADAYGNVFGFYQWLSWPPILLSTNAVLHYRWKPQSWGYETIYGTSRLMPLIKNNDLLNQYENDMATWVHTYGKPMLDVAMGTPEQPYSDPQFLAEQQKWQKRTPGSDVLHKSNINIQVIKGNAPGGAAGALTPWEDYLLSRRKEELGVPDILMAQASHGVRATGTVQMEDFIVECEIKQTFLAEPFEQKVFPALLKANGFGKKTVPKKKKPKPPQPTNTLNPPPQPKPEPVEMEEIDLSTLEYTIVFKPIFEEDPNTRSQRLIDLRKVCGISVNELRSQLPDTEAIGEDDPHYKPELDDPLFPPPAPAKPPGADGFGDIVKEEGMGGALAPAKLNLPEGPQKGDTNYQAERVEARHGHADVFTKGVTAEHELADKLKTLIIDFKQGKVKHDEALQKGREIIDFYTKKSADISLNRFKQKSGVEIKSLAPEMQTSIADKGARKYAEFSKILDDSK